MAIQPGDTLVQVELASKTLIAADNIVNTWAMRSTTGTGTPEDATSALDAFYAALSSYWGPQLAAGNVHQVKFYALVEPEPRPPWATTVFTQIGGGTGLPVEVACCSSFSAQAPAGVRPARRRGRVFLGPLNTTTMTADAASYPRPNTTFRTAVANAMEGLCSDLLLANWELCVWSRADNGLFPVTHGWINDEFDTQRRRGPEVTARTTWSIST